MNEFLKIVFTISVLLLMNVSMSVAQCGPLTTLFASDNNQDGIMFDVQAIIDITVTSMPINCEDPGMPYEMEIYYRPGTHVGFENSAAGWTLIGSNVGTPFIGGPTDTPTLVPIVLNQQILAGQTGAFYVTEIGTGGNMAYTDGVLTGSLSVTDGNVNIFEGTGKEYPFAQSFNPRVPNFTLEYDCCPMPLLDSIPESCTGAMDASIIAEGQGLGPWDYTFEDATGFVVWDTTGVNGPVTFSSATAGIYTVSTTDANSCTSQETIVVTSDLDVVVTPVVTDNVCFGGSLGSVEITLTGGIAPYTVAWADPFGNIISTEIITGNVATLDSLPSATVNAFVTDANGCLGVGGGSPAQPPAALVLTTTLTDLNCFGVPDGAIEVESDGAAPFTYEIYDVLGNQIDSVPSSPFAPFTFSNLGSGDFFISITDGDGCEVNGIETLTEPLELAVESSSIPMLCHNQAAGVATIDLISGGTPPYATVSWDDPAAQTGNSAIDLLPGIYTATIVDDNGCSLTEEIEFINPPALNLNPSYLTDTCNAGVGSAAISVTQGAPPYTFFWKLDGLDTPIHPDLFQGSYEVVVTDANNCSDSTFVQVVDSLTYPIASFDHRFNLDEDQLSQQVIFEDLSFDATQWEWNFGNGESLNEKNPIFNYEVAGDYLVQLVVSNGFCFDTAYDYVNIDPLLTVYIPNAFTPGRNNINDRFGPRGEGIELESWDMFIYDRWGKLVWQTGNYDKFWDGTNWFNGEKVAVGTYVYHIKFREFADLDRQEYSGWVNVLRD